MLKLEADLRAAKKDEAGLERTVAEQSEYIGELETANGALADKVKKGKRKLKTQLEVTETQGALIEDLQGEIGKLQNTIQALNRRLDIATEDRGGGG